MNARPAQHPASTTDARKRADVAAAAFSPIDVRQKRVEDLLREARAEAWDEGALWAAVECGAIKWETDPWLTAGDNPYRGGGDV